MRLRRNEYTVLSTDHSSAAAGKARTNPGWYGSACSVLKIRITREDIGNYDRQRK
jgi:hypothetical protein